MTIKAEIVSRLVPKYRDNLNWARFIKALERFDVSEQNRVLNALKRDQMPLGWKTIVSGLRKQVKAAAEAEADTMLANGSLDLTELNRVLK